ncbi:MAG TPA: ABC transporter permease [Mucilaginibacter sp.]|jgi:predicted permease|nr:ABC transporter permease [Mucilaginibacter sp.]
MIKTFIRTAIRNLQKNKGFSFLNIFGLAIGITCAALIFLWVENEVSYDTNNLKKDRLYLVKENQKYDTYVYTHSSTPGIMGPEVKETLPGIANTCRTSEGGTTYLFSQGDKSVYATGQYADPSIFSMFTLPFVQGNAQTAFKQYHSIVITERAAKKFFGNEKDVIGKSIRVDNKQDYVVSGVIKDLPTNSTLQFEWLMPFQIHWDDSPYIHYWGNNNTTTYVELKQGASYATVNRQMLNYIQRHELKDIAHMLLFSMNDWHLRDDFKDGKLTGGGQIFYVHLFSTIAWIILFIACINFMNLATARSEKRAREVGVRKVLGAGKRSLVAQFIGESVFLALLAAVIAIILLIIVLPAFNLLVQKQLTVGFDDPYHIIALVLIAVICGVVAGSYPSLYLSSFRPVAVLKGLKLKDSGASFVRKGLVILQFTASIVLIISTVIIYQQIQHIKDRPLGFNRNNLLRLPLQGDMAKNYYPIRQELLNSGYFADVALADHDIIYGGNNTDGMTWQGKDPSSKVLISQRYVTPDYMRTAGLKILEGRNLTVTDTGRPVRMVITKSLEKLLGKGSALGKTMHYNGDTTMATVVGVVNDYVYGNMYGKPDPVMFFTASPQYNTLMYVRLQPHADLQKALAGVQSVLKKYNPRYPFDYQFVDDQFNNMFYTEGLASKLSRLFASLAILISCLGLFGLAAYTAERRTKEIGIRKVLGASIASVTTLLSKDFLVLVGLSCIAAFPLAYYAMSKWLKGYDYHIDIHLWVFAAAGITAAVIALITVSYQAIKAALANPVKTLRSE